MSPKASDSDGTVKLKAVPTTAPKATAVKTEKVSVTQIVAGATPVVAGMMLKKPDFIDRAVAKTEVKKRDAKPAIEAALAVLAEALLAGEEMNLPPMGKLKVVKSKEIGDGAQVLTLKLRTMKDGAGQGAGNSGVAQSDDDD